MLKSISNKVLQIRSVTGMEICFLGDEELIINLATVKLNKSSLTKENEYHLISGLSQIKEKITTDLPIALVVSGKGIIHKKLPISEVSANPLESILPAANPIEFHIEIAKSGDSTYLSVIRKDLLEKLITDLKILGFKILSVSIGGFKHIVQMLPMITVTGIYIPTPYYNMTIGRENQLDNITTVPFNKNSYENVELNIGDQYVFSLSVLAFAAAASLISNPIIQPQNPIKSIGNEQESYVYYKWYKAALWTALISLFLVLIVNFLLFNHYFSKNTEMGLTNTLSTEVEEKEAFFLADIKRKETFIRLNGWAGQSKLSLLSDRIGSMVAGSMVLTSMNLNPAISNDFAGTENLNFKKDTIEITGICDDPEDLNVFMNNVKESPIFKEINIKNYLYKRESAKGYFSIEIISH